MAVTNKKVKVVTTMPAGPAKDNAPSASAPVTILQSRPKQTPPTTNAGFDWKPWATALGGGLLLHTLASSFMNNKTDEEKRRESIWERLLGAVIPLGLGGLGMYGGYRLGQSMNKVGQAVTNDFRVVTAPNGKEIAVPDNDAANIDAILQYLDDNPDAPVNLDAAYQNLRAARKDDEQGWGYFLANPAETVTTWGQPVMHGIGAYKGIKAGWKDFASGVSTLRKSGPGAIKQQVNSAADAGRNFADTMAYIQKLKPEEQLRYARANGFASFQEMVRGMARGVGAQQAAANANQAAASANRRAGAISVAKGVAKGGAKALPWTLYGLGVGALDSALEKEQDAQMKRKNLAQFASKNLQRIQQTLDNSKILDDPKRTTE